MAHARVTEEPAIVTASTVARLLERSESTIRLWASNGVLRPVGRTPTGIALFAMADVRRLQAERDAARHRFTDESEAEFE